MTTLPAALEACTVARKNPVLDYLCKIVTPLHLQAWQEALASNPDQAFAAHIYREIHWGFKIGCATELADFRPRKGNLVSALEHPEVVDKYLHEEMQANQIIRVSPSEDTIALGFHCSPFEVIPKKNRPNKWRLIVDLSAPQGHSVNDGIRKELATLSYVSVDDFMEGIIQYGKGTKMAKMDIRHAYRNVPIHPCDRPFWA